MNAPEQWSTLRRFARPGPAAERCELCGAEIPAQHEHLLDPAQRKLLCACSACAILFSHQAAGRYRRIPREVRLLVDFHLTDAEWNGLSIPVGLAFFFRSTAEGRVAAVYPSPAGATQSLLDFDNWEEITAANPVLQQIEPDVEALLVNRVGSARDYYLAPIDECYRLVGLLRAGWRGLSGGSQVWEEIRRFFDALKERADRSPAGRDTCLT